jgi:stage IV sporulation protein A
MEKFDLFQDLAERTGGDIYLGVVGPVRTGKSTLIKRFMERMVLPAISDPNDRERALDSLPQSGSGRTVMTTEPKFIPDEGVEIQLNDAVSFRTRLVDCVGYTVPGALGYADGDGPRMVLTPWSEDPVPFEQAAELGTQRVIQEHATIGLVVTTDGSFGDLPRDAYVAAEQRVIGELKELGKPFVVVLNTVAPDSPEARQLAEELRVAHDVPVIAANCQDLTADDITQILEDVLYEFPVVEMRIELGDWLPALPAGHWLLTTLTQAADDVRSTVHRLRDVAGAMAALEASDLVDDVRLEHMEPGAGTAALLVRPRSGLLHRVLGEMADRHVGDDGDIVRLWREFAAAKAEWDKVSEAIQEVRATGYGMVPPQVGDLILDEPELIRRGNQFGMRLRATAPSVHMIRADIETELTPIVGTERQADELVQFLMDQFEDDPQKLWETNLFGKPLHDLVREGIQAKLFRMPENAQEKLQDTLQRIINEGSGGLICIIL